MIDPFVLAEAAQEALDRLGELTARRVRGCLIMHSTRYTGWARALLRSGRPRQRGVDAAVAVRRRPLVRSRSAGTRPEGVMQDAAHPDRAAEGAERAPVRPASARST